MHPLLSDTLNFSKLARYLSIEWSGIRSADEVLSDLISAMWRGDLATIANDKDNRTDRVRRKDLLTSMASHDHPGILFARPGEILPPEKTEHPDGSADIDPRIRVAWPVCAGSDKEIAFEAATKEISQAGIDDYAEMFKPILSARQISREAYGAYCDQQGLERPKFWFSQSARRSARAASGACKRWLGDHIAKAQTPIPKETLRAEAMKSFTISGREFDRVWKSCAPKAWKAPGRRAT